MNQDTAGVVAPPPLIYALAIVAGIVLDRFVPLPLAGSAARPLGVGIGIAGLLLAIWAIVTFHRAGTPAPTRRPTTTIVSHGPYRFSRNPIYVGFTAMQIGLAISRDAAWLLLTLLPALAVMSVGVIAREERYLTRKFGEAYTSYRTRVRRWV